jgi:hypothetical protein
MRDAQMSTASVIFSLSASMREFSFVVAALCFFGDGCFAF